MIYNNQHVPKRGHPFESSDDYESITDENRPLKKRFKDIDGKMRILVTHMPAIGKGGIRIIKPSENTTTATATVKTNRVAKRPTLDKRAGFGRVQVVHITEHFQEQGAERHEFRYSASFSSSATYFSGKLNTKKLGYIAMLAPALRRAYVRAETLEVLI